MLLTLDQSRLVDDFYGQLDTIPFANTVPGIVFNVDFKQVADREN